MKDRISKEEVEKWLSKLKKEIENVKPVDKKGEELLKNIQAYVYDTEHFIKEEYLVKAWESISFAWGLFEAGVDVEVLSKRRSV